MTCTLRSRRSIFAALLPDLPMVVPASLRDADLRRYCPSDAWGRLAVDLLGRRGASATALRCG
jgi:hypothetical protein